MESNQRRGSSQEEPYDDSWADDSPTEHVERVNADDQAQAFDDERPDFVPYQPEERRTQVADERTTSPWAVIAGILGAILAAGAGIWAYTALSDDGDRSTSANDSNTSTVVVSHDPATEGNEESGERPPAEEGPAPSEEESDPVPYEPEGENTAPTVVTFDEGEGVEPVRPDAPEPAAPQPRQRPQQQPSTSAQPNSSQAPSSALQCAANVNWRVFSTTGNGGCDNAEAVAIAMADHSGSGQESVEVAVPAAEGDEPTTATCELQGDNSYECEANGVTVFLEDRAVRD